MPKLSMLTAAGDEEEELPITDHEAEILRNGFNSGMPFSFVSDSPDRMKTSHRSSWSPAPRSQWSNHADPDDITAWVWIDPAKYAMVTIEED